MQLSCKIIKFVICIARLPPLIFKLLWVAMHVPWTGFISACILKACRKMQVAWKGNEYDYWKYLSSSSACYTSEIQSIGHIAQDFDGWSSILGCAWNRRRGCSYVKSTQFFFVKSMLNCWLDPRMPMCVFGSGILDRSDEFFVLHMTCRSFILPLCGCYFCLISVCLLCWFL